MLTTQWRRGRIRELSRRARRSLRRTPVMMGSMIAVVGILRVPHLSAQSGYTVFSPPSQVSGAAMDQPTGASHASITLLVPDSTVQWAVAEIARQAHLRPMFTQARSMQGRIRTHIQDADVGDALRAVLKGTGLIATMSPDGETVIIHPASEKNPLSARALAVGMIAGRVTDSATGAGLGGASVRVAGTKLSSVTSDSGNFTLRDVPAGEQVLTVRLFGYKPVDRQVTVVDSQRTVVRIAMASVPTVLSGVVTTATGMQRKIEVGNDITTLNVDSIMQVAPVNTVADLLETRVPGLTVLHTSGDPGAPSRLRLRGVGSITGNNDPIVIVDGIRVYASQSDTRNDNLAKNPDYSGASSASVGGFHTTNFSAPSPIDQIDPSTIASIEVFKGPSASALYGSDAANGVIVITTKHGRAGPTQWTLDLGAGVNWIPGDWPVNYFRFGVNTLNEGPICNWYDPTCIVIDSVRTFQALNTPAYTVFSHGSNQRANLTVSGGSGTVQYSLTGSGSGQLGNLKLPEVEQQRYSAAFGGIPGWMVRPDRYSTWGLGGTVTAAPTPTLRATFQSSVFNGNQQTSTLQSAISQLEGVYISGGYATYADGTEHDLAANSLIVGYVQHVTDAQTTTQNNLSVSWSPRPWLPLSITGGIQTIDRSDASYVPYGVSVSGPGCDPDLSSHCNDDTTGYYGAGHGLSHDQTLTVGTTLPLPDVDLAIGGNYYSVTTSDFAQSTSQLAPGVTIPSNFFATCAGTTTICGSSTAGSSSAATYGWYVEPRLKFASRFFASPGFRLDGGSGGTHSTSTGGAAGGLSAFPKLDLSYLAVDRTGHRPMWGFLTMLRPRASFGVGGTQPSPEQRLRLFQSVDDTSGNIACETFPLNGVTVPGACLTALGNTQLHPERSRELEGGFDVTLWNGRVTMTYTQYNKTRTDAIINVPVAPSVSNCTVVTFADLCQIAENIGNVRNTGTELTANVTVLESRALSWNVGANLSNDNNLLVHLNPGQSPNYNLGIVPGYPLFGRWVLPILSYADQNQDGVIETNEVRLGDSVVFTGAPNPKYQVNLTTDLHLLSGRLGVYATFAYQNGLTQINDAALSSGTFQMLGNNPSTGLAYQAAVTATRCAYEGCGTSSTTYGLIQTVNTFRFQDLSINYELPRSAAAWFRVPRVMIALQGSNLALHTNYRGKDPDVNAFSTVSSADQTADMGEVPEPRTWWLKFTFGN